MKVRYFGIVFSFLLFCGSNCFGQAEKTGSSVVPLVVPAGVPLHIELDKKLPVKNAGVPVEGRVVEPVYVFDRLVIPAGAQVEGQVTKVENATRKRRALAMADGDFSPIRKADITFNTLVLKDGSKLPLRTEVSQGAPSLVRLTAGDKGRKKGRVGSAVDRARAQVKAREEATVEEIRSPGKLKRLKAMLVAEMPYHKSQLPVGTEFTAELQAPLKFGNEICPPEKLDHLGDQVPSGSTVRVRLLTALSSATAHRGTPVEAVVSAPVYSSDHQLILPEGARLKGLVTQSLPARRLGRNGQLRFAFRQIDFTQNAVRQTGQVEATLQSVDTHSGTKLKIDEEGGARAVTPKTNYIAPAISIMLATSSLDGLDPHNKDRIADGLGPQGPDMVGGAVRGGSGMKLVGLVIGLAAHYRPVSSAFAFYGAGRSVYSHVVARGTDVVFPKDTPMEILFGERPGSKPPAAAKKFASLETAPK